VAEEPATLAASTTGERNAVPAIF